MSNDKIREHTEYVPNQYTPKHMIDKAVREYDRGLLAHLETSKDPSTQILLNELAVRRNDDYYHGRER